MEAVQSETSEKSVRLAVQSLDFAPILIDKCSRLVRKRWARRILAAKYGSWKGSNRSARSV